MKLQTGLAFMLGVVAAAQESENSILATYGDRAFRPDSATLCIVTDRGDTLLLADQPDPEYMEEYVVFDLISFLPEQNCWVITKTFCEWAVTLLVNGSSGRSALAVSPPEPSPDGSRLLCASEDIVLGELRNRLQIWRVDPDSLALEFEFRNEPWGPVEAGWEGDSLIVFDRLTYDVHLDEYSTRPGSLRLSGDGIWTPDDGADW